MVNDTELLARCTREIEELHTFFQAWFSGELANDEAIFGRFANTLHPDFTIVSPNGTIENNATIQQLVRSAHGSGAIKIHIENVTARKLSNEIILAQYEEWQTRDGNSKGRGRAACCLSKPGTHQTVCCGFTFTKPGCLSMRD